MEKANLSQEGDELNDSYHVEDPDSINFDDRQIDV